MKKNTEISTSANAIICQANIGLWAFEIEDNKPPRMFVDDTMLKVMGITQPLSPEKLYEEWYSRIYEEHLPTVQNCVKHLLQGEWAEVQYPWRHPTKGKTYVRCGGVKNNNFTKFIRIEGTHQDVTELVHLQKQEAHLADDIIASLTQNYEGVFLVNVDTDEIRELRVSTEYTSHVKRYVTTQKYTQRILDGIKNNIVPEDRERIKREFDPKNVFEILKTSVSHYCTYRIKSPDGDGIYYRAKFTRIQNDSRSFILGIRNCDAEKRLELKSDEVEQTRTNIVKILSENYTGLYFFNLNTGAGSIVSVSDKIKKDTGKNLANSPNLVFAFKNFITSLVHPDDLHLFQNISGLDSLKQVLAHKKRHSIVFRRNFGGVYEYSEMTFAKAEDPDEPPVHVAIGFATIDEVYQAKLRQEVLLKQANEELSVSKAYTDLFIDTYISAYYVNIEDGTFTTYRRADEIKQKYGKITNYYDSIRAYIDADVNPADRELMYNATDYKHMHHILQDTNEYSVVFRANNHGSERYIRMHVIKADDKHAAICFADVDKDIRERAQLEAIENAHENSLAMENALLALQADNELGHMYVFLQMICECLHVDNCYVSRFNAANNSLTVEPKYSVFPDGTVENKTYTMMWGKFPTHRAKMLKRGYEELSGEDIQQLWNAYGLPENDPCRELRSLTGLPILVHGKLWGCLNVAYVHHHTLDTNELHFLKRAALFLSSAIARKDAYALSEKAKEEAQLEADFANMVIDTNPNPCFLKDANDDFRYIRCNDAFLNHLQVTKEQIVGHNDRDIFGVKQSKIINEHDKTALKMEGPHIYEGLGSSNIDQERILIRWKQQLKGKDGHRLILGVLTDVTNERKRVAAETFKADVSTYIANYTSTNISDILNYTAAKLMDFFKCEHVMLHCVDGSRKDWYINSHGTFCNLCENCPMKGASPAFFGTDNMVKIDDTTYCKELKLPKGCPTKSIMARQIYVNGVLWGKLAVLFTGKHHRFLEICSRVMQMAVDGIVIAIQKANAFEEISRKNAELSQALEEAKCAERVKSTFLATMSHEIRTPLNAVIGFSEFLRNPNCNEENRNEYLDGIAKSSNALLSLINDILDLSKLESNAVDMKNGKCDMLKLFNEMKSVFQFKTQEKHLALSFSISKSFPLLTLHEERIRQILLNLIGNAVKFTSQGEISCAVQWHKATNTMQLKVRDTGTGIAKDKQKSIFDPFIQDSGVRGEKVYEGTGLGLPISKRLAEAAGGKLTLTSVVGKGSTFTLTIPDITVINETKAVSSQKSLAIEAAKGVGPKLACSGDTTIVLIDDVRMNLRILAQHLKNLGVKDEQICQFTSAEEALTMLKDLKNKKQILVFTDMWMPGMNGDEFARKLKESKQLKHIPLVAITADADAQSSFDISLFDAILTKPVTINSFKNLLIFK